MPPENEERYQDILKRIAEHGPYGEKRQRARPLQTPHERALDRINAYDCLAELTGQEYDQWLCYGPKKLHGAAWAGAVVWAHRQGYYGYQRLTLHGVWAHYANDDIMLSIATRHLPYSAPVYSAGIFRAAIRSNFKIYYHDSGGPPAESAEVHYRSAFDEAKRLRQRQALKEIVKRWRRDMDAG